MDLVTVASAQAGWGQVRMIADAWRWRRLFDTPRCRQRLSLQMSLGKGTPSSFQTEVGKLQKHFIFQPYDYCPTCGALIALSVALAPT
jgi:hypothetical protein